MSIELVSLSDLKTMLDIQTTKNDAKLTLIRDGVTATIEQFIGRELEFKTRTEKISVGIHFKRMISLKALPVDDIGSITLQYNTDTESETLSENDYTITDYGVELGYGVKNCQLTIEYDGGYFAADVPSQIGRAALLQTCFEFNSSVNVGATSVSNSGGSVRYPNFRLLFECRQILESLKHPFMLV